MLIGLIGTALAILLQVLFKSWLLTVVCMIAYAVLMYSLRPYYEKLSAKIFPLPPIQVLSEENMGEDSEGHGMRMLLVTRSINLSSGNEQEMAIAEQLFSDAVADLSEKKPLFELRYRTVMQKSLPIQKAMSMCGEKDRGIRKSYWAWLKFVNQKAFGMWKENKELFLYDGQFQDPGTGEPTAAAVLILFDARLPQTLNTPGSEPAGNIPPDTQKKKREG